MKVREWPPGHRLFTEGGFHLAFDPPTPPSGMPAILLRVDEAREVAEVLAVSVFTDDTTALAWFEEQRRKFGN